MAKPKEGQYFITRLRGRVAIYRYKDVTEHGYCGEYIDTCNTFEEGVRRMYELNGWNEPKGGFRFSR